METRKNGIQQILDKSLNSLKYADNLAVTVWVNLHLLLYSELWKKLYSLKWCITFHYKSLKVIKIGSNQKHTYNFLSLQ